MTGAVAEVPAAESGLLERHFKMRERGSNTRTEVLAGFTTFLTMAYIVLVNPAILGQAGMPVASVAAATCFAAAFASILMGMVANTPLALAPGMGLNAYFSFTVVQQMGVPWPIALGCVFISGVAFLILTLTGVRQLIVSVVPQHLFAAVAGGIGLFIGFIGLKDAGIVVANPATFVGLGSVTEPGPALALFGLVVIGTLSVWNVRAAMLIGIVLTTIAAWITGQTSAPTEPYSLAALTGTAFQLDILGVFGLSGQQGIGLVEILFVFLFVDLFDNIGTLVAVTKRAGLMDAAGKIPGLNRILMTDAVATMVGAMAGTSTVTSYVESAAGVQAGGRTGLTAVVCGLLFFATMFVAPYAQLVPLAATAPALVVVGGLMLLPLTEVDWEDPMAAIPAFLTVAMIPLTFSIANGLAFGITAHALLKLLKGKATRADWFLFTLAALFVVRFAWMAAE
ncbi:MAG: guanine permease [Novosphingobium sp. 28-62-57]|uniref:NCS2 family permease n=1 Tax=unclassified Novosphingobium TaxID=2644732 RepID=UPI000BD4D854|nr:MULTISPECIES: NCS2 family permease [unclassified Novosphingobium]OYW49950.1 MAG: guanine permease [Novosphingobium sp. 12-62-10]OYZ12104.1 MAG: guanine permease [Novosphingobium sp. 28-62-57]